MSGHYMITPETLVTNIGAPEAPFAEWQSRFGLTQPALSQLAKTVTGETPETAGVTAALAGLRTLHPDDLSYLAASLPLFDALHRAFCDVSEKPRRKGEPA